MDNDIRLELNQVEAQIRRLKFERGFLRGLTAAVNALNDSMTIDEAKEKIATLTCPEE